MISAIASSAYFPVQRAESPAAPSAGAAAGSDFGSLLDTLVNQSADTLKRGEAAAIAGVHGTLPVQQVVEQVMAAERTLQTAIGIRDKLVGVYLELSRMQI